MLFPEPLTDPTEVLIPPGLVALPPQPTRTRAAAANLRELNIAVLESGFMVTSFNMPAPAVSQNDGSASDPILDG